jgi:hypothetical protein
MVASLYPFNVLFIFVDYRPLPRLYAGAISAARQSMSRYGSRKYDKSHTEKRFYAGSIKAGHQEKAEKYAAGPERYAFGGSLKPVIDVRESYETQTSEKIKK